ncbi:MAG: PilZ domain-containing protein [Planctomycetes bacterium]|nr:PilZ domain-containing protein [Planctomycetota bacterium]
MNEGTERVGQVEQRKEKRLHCDWVIWLTDPVTEKRYHGMIHDLSSGGVAFICHGDESFPQKDQHITTYFYVPEDESDAPCKVTQMGVVCHINELDKFVRKVHVKFDEPLPFKPADMSPAAVDVRED